MKATILNRNFQHPTDGWYMIEPLGEHPNRAGGLVQVLDQTAAESIVNRFNADAEAGQLPHGHEMLIDHEHFKHDAGKETTAYGWLAKLTNRTDGIYGQIRWTKTGQAAVDGGDYRFFSTEYDKRDLAVLNDGKPRRVRPLRLDGLTLTNDPNNKGGRPITNRALRPATLTDGKACCPDCDCALAATDQAGVLNCPECETNFASVSAPAAKEKETNPPKKMKNIATKLGLVADANEDSIVAAIGTLQNRVSTLEPLATENTTLKNRLTELDGVAVDALLASRGVKDEKVLNRLKPIIAATSVNERAQALEDLGFKVPTTGMATAAATRVLNRGTGTTPTLAAETDANAEQVRASKIRNRANVLRKEGMSYDAAFVAATQEVDAK